MTEPTDEELLDCARGKSGHIDFARAVLAKWGTPAPVGAEPVAWLAEYGGDVYSAAQVQAMLAMGREPLTEAQAQEIVELESWGPDALALNAQLLRTIRRTESAHGIKGGQHAE